MTTGIMTSTSENFTVRCPDTIELESRNDSYNYDHDISICTPGNDITLSLDDTTSSIVSDSTESSTIDCNMFSAQNLPQNLPQDVSSNHICINESSDILIGNRTHFNGTVVIKNFIAGNDGQNPIVSNHDIGKLETPASVEEETSDRSCFCLLRKYIPCKSKWVFILLVVICVLSALSGLAVAAYFLYLHFAVYTVAGALFVCKTIDPAVCYVGSSTTSCSNLRSADGRPYISGHTTAEYTCRIFSKTNCQGDMQEIRTDHISFYFYPLSARC